LAAQGITTARQVRQWLGEQFRAERVGRRSSRARRLTTTPAPRDIDSGPQLRTGKLPKRFSNENRVGAQIVPLGAQMRTRRVLK
jgi:hypothetical protein